MSKIAILHLMNGFGDASIGWIVHRLIVQLGSQEFAWHVSGLCAAGTMQAKYDQLGAKTVDFSQPEYPDRMMWQRIRRYILDNHIAIIHSHTPRTIIHACLATVRLSGTIHLATKHLLTDPKDRKWGLPIAVYDRFSLYLPDHLVAVSETMTKRISSTPFLPARRVTAIPNAIPVENFFLPELRDDCRREFGLTPETIAIGFASRIEKVKRIDLLLFAFQEIFERYPHTRLLLVGEGSMQAELQSLADRLGISPAVIWTGFRSDMPRILAALDIFVQPSINEGLSLATLEAMAAGKPVIATEVGGTAEIIQNNLTGLLIPPGSFQSISAALVDLLDHSEKRDKLAHAGQASVNTKFDIQRMTDSYQHLYQKLANGKSSEN